MKGQLVFETSLSLSYEQAREAVEAALKEEGFGVLTHVDAQATFKEKLNENFRPFSILGVCKPTFAHRLLQNVPQIGLVLPCKVTVEANNEGSIVRFINPEMMTALGFDDNPVISQVALEAKESILRVVKALEEL
jgi:uncharacterized protein (DUF302 family)